jgi:hypothetical protein
MTSEKFEEVMILDAMIAPVLSGETSVVDESHDFIAFFFAEKDWGLDDAHRRREAGVDNDDCGGDSVR